MVNVRGPNGSGKSTVAHALLSVGEASGMNPAGVPSTLTKEGVAVIGPYRTQCGGLDAVKTQAQARNAVLGAAALVGGRGDRGVLAEGVIVSTIYGPWLEVARSIEEMGGRYVWAFLDTPLEVCLERIQARNGGKPVKADQITAKHDLMRRIADKARADGQTVVQVPYANAVNVVRDLLGLPPMKYEPGKPAPARSSLPPRAPAPAPQAELFS